MKKTYFIAIAIAAILVLGGYGVWYSQKNDEGPIVPEVVNDTTPVVNPEGDKVNPDGTSVGGAGDELLVDSDETPAGTPVPVKPGETVGVTLSRATMGDKLLTVSGFAETTKGGTCTLTLSKSGQKTLTYTNPAELEVSNVSCNPFRVPLSDFPAKGQWKAVIAFAGPSLSGTSNEWIVQL